MLLPPLPLVQPGSLLDIALTVKATDLGGNGVQGVAVWFAFTSVPAEARGNLVSKSLVATDSLGLASTEVQLGDKQGMYVVGASSDTLTGSPIFFTLRAIDSATTTVALETIPAQFEVFLKCLYL